jgi:hypothetical protein
MKRLKLKCIESEEKPQLKEDYFKKFDIELKKYCLLPKNKNVLPYKWYHTKEQWPPDINEEILVFEDGNFKIERSFVALQNLIYRLKVINIDMFTDYYWMRIKTPSGNPQYEDNRLSIK